MTYYFTRTEIYTSIVNNDLSLFIYHYNDVLNRSTMIYYIIKFGRINFLQYMDSKGFKWKSSDLNEACILGNFEAFLFLMYKVKIDDCTVLNTIFGNNIRLLEYLGSKDLINKKDPRIMKTAISCNRLDMVEYLLEHGHVVTERVTNESVEKILHVVEIKRQLSDRWHWDDHTSPIQWLSKELLEQALK